VLDADLPERREAGHRMNKWSVLQRSAEGEQNIEDREGRRPPIGWAGKLWLVRLEDNFGFRLCEKCGIHTMREILVPRGFARYSNMWPAPKRTAFVCRNPYDRMVSVWWGIVHVEWRANKERIEQIGSDDFPDFVRWITDPKLQETRSIYRTQADWLGDVEVTDVVHLENLAEELPLILGPVEIPHLNECASVRQHWSTYYDDDTKAIVRRWAFEDCRRFGYNPDP
jgi:hypothetical protein